jgi:hypothetical protein
VNDSKAHKQKKTSKVAAPKRASAKAAAASSASASQDAGLSYDLVKARAYELYVSRGGEHGRDQDDWFRAEQEIIER